MKPELKTGEEQMQFWKSLGYDGLIDEARNQKSAIINDREPWQAVFFNKKFFKIVDIYELNPKSEYLSAGGLGTSKDEAKLHRKLAAMIAMQIGDKIKEFSKEKSWTKKGRRIDTEFSFPQSYMDNLNLGEKPHKYSKKYDHHRIRVNIYSEKEPYNFSWDAETKFIDIAKEIGEDWKTLKDRTDFVPEFSRKEMESKEVDARHEKRKLDNIKLIKSYESDITTLAEIYGVKWEPLSDQEWYRAYIEASYVQMKTNAGKTLEDYLEDEKASWEGHEHEKKYSQGAEQMLALLDKIYHDNTKFKKKGFVGGDKDKYHQEPVETTIANEVKHLRLRSGWFSDNEYLIFKDVMQWKTDGEGE